jgi:hypothetical protein
MLMLRRAFRMDRSVQDRNDQEIIDQFVGQMDRPSISLDSIKSERNILSACVIRGQARKG